MKNCLGFADSLLDLIEQLSKSGDQTKPVEKAWCSHWVLYFNLSGEKDKSNWLWSAFGKLLKMIYPNYKAKKAFNVNNLKKLQWAP